MTESKEHGIKETKEMMVGMQALTLVMMEHFKDGAQFSDALELWESFKNDAKFKAQLMAAYDGYKKIPAEIKDLDLLEGFELGKQGVDFAGAILMELKK